MTKTQSATRERPTAIPELKTVSKPRPAPQGQRLPGDRLRPDRRGGARDGAVGQAEEELRPVGQHDGVEGGRPAAELVYRPHAGLQLGDAIVLEVVLELDRLQALDRGLGMSSMKRRAKQMHGQCLVQSGPGYGTVIALTVPL